MCHHDPLAKVHSGRQNVCRRFQTHILLIRYKSSKPTVSFYLKCTGCYSVSSLRMRLILNPGMTEENDEFEPYLTDANINRVKSIIKKYNDESK